MSSVMTTSSAYPPRFSRKWFGEMAIGLWGLSLVVNLVFSLADWDDSGLGWALIQWPLGLVSVSALVVWLVMVVRDARAQRDAVWRQTVEGLRIGLPVAAGFGALLALMWAAGLLT